MIAISPVRTRSDNTMQMAFRFIFLLIFNE